MKPKTHIDIETMIEATALQKRRSNHAQWVAEVGGVFPPIELVTRPNLKTEEAAFYLNRRPQTLRAWACLENGPIRPRRIGGLLAWPTIDVKALSGVAT